MAMLVSITGCNRSTVKLDTYHEDVREGIAQASDDDSRIYIRTVSDIRKDKSSLGSLGLTDVASDDIFRWLKSAFDLRGYVVDTELDPDQKVCVTDVGLKLAYIRSSSTSKATNIVLAVNDARTGQLTSHAGMNWNSSEEEIKTAFNLALQDALDLLEAGVLQNCEAFATSQNQ